MKRPVKDWWKRQPDSFRKVCAFIIGMLLIIMSPIVGSIPGPGGMLVFLAGIGVLATEFDWAENLKAVLVEKVPRELKKRWQPTPRWATVFDITTILLLGAAIVFYIHRVYLPVISFTSVAVFLAMFNRNRLGRFKNFLKHKQ